MGIDIVSYHIYLRLVGENDGKDFVVVHALEHKNVLCATFIRGEFD